MSSTGLEAASAAAIAVTKCWEREGEGRLTVLSAGSSIDQSNSDCSVFRFTGFSERPPGVAIATGWCATGFIIVLLFAA